MDVLMRSFPKFSLKLFFEMLMDGAPKIQATFFLEHKWMPLNRWKKR